MHRVCGKGKDERRKGGKKKKERVRERGNEEGWEKWKGRRERRGERMGRRGERESVRRGGEWGEEKIEKEERKKSVIDEGKTGVRENIADKGGGKWREMEGKEGEEGNREREG